MENITAQNTAEKWGITRLRVLFVQKSESKVLLEWLIYG